MTGLCMCDIVGKALHTQLEDLGLKGKPASAIASCMALDNYLISLSPHFSIYKIGLIVQIIEDCCGSYMTKSVIKNLAQCLTLNQILTHMPVLLLSLIFNSQDVLKQSSGCPEEDK